MSQQLTIDKTSISKVVGSSMNKYVSCLDNAHKALSARHAVKFVRSYVEESTGITSTAEDSSGRHEHIWEKQAVSAVTQTMLYKLKRSAKQRGRNLKLAEAALKIVILPSLVLPAIKQTATSEQRANKQRV